MSHERPSPRLLYITLSAQLSHYLKITLTSAALVDGINGQHLKVHHADQWLWIGKNWQVEIMGLECWVVKDFLQQLWIKPLNRFHFWMFHVCLGVLCRRILFQRKKRSVSMKKKRTRKSLSRTKAKPLSFLAPKKSPAKKFATKKKRQMPGYQATAPARPRGNFRVNVHVKKDRMPSRSSCLEGKICDGRHRAP